MEPLEKVNLKYDGRVGHIKGNLDQGFALETACKPRQGCRLRGYLREQHSLSLLEDSTLIKVSRNLSINSDKVPRRRCRPQGCLLKDRKEAIDYLDQESTLEDECGPRWRCHPPL